MPGTINSLRILVVEDDEDDFLLINDYFRHLRTWKCEVKWVYRYDEAINELVTNAYTICFSDYRLGAKNGIDLIKDILARNCNTPVILLTGKGNYEIDKEATKAGAFDYLVKAELDEDKLERTIRYTLERMMNIQRLRVSERKYRSIFEKSKDIVFVSAMDTSIINVNYAVMDILETTVEACIGRKMIDFFHLQTQRQVFLQQLTKNGEVENHEVGLVTTSHIMKTCLISATIENDSEGDPYIQGIVHDITDLKKAELASLQAEKLAASGRFIRTLAHEVRNPLNNIVLSIENLLQQINSEDDRIYLDIIERNGKRINDLITELLDSSRPAEISLKLVSLQDVMENVIKAVGDRSILRRINIHYHHLGHDCMIRADSPKLEMAFLNIVINAIEAVKDETGIIEITTHSGPERVEVVISDNGCGISPENKAKLFEPYFTSKRNGMGLGLATSLNILRAHSADIEVYSEVDVGTTFRILFSDKQTYLSLTE